MPGKIEELTLKPGSHNIRVNWKKPIGNSNCFTQYVIDWVKFPNASSNNIIVWKEENSFVIEQLDACSRFGVSVRATNDKGECSGAVSGNTSTETDGNCYSNILL